MIEKNVPEPGDRVVINGKIGFIRFVDRPWMKDGKLADLLIRVSFDGKHGSWHRVSDIEEIKD